MSPWKNRILTGGSRNLASIVLRHCRGTSESRGSRRHAVFHEAGFRTSSYNAAARNATTESFAPCATRPRSPRGRLLERRICLRLLALSSVTAAALRQERRRTPSARVIVVAGSAGTPVRDKLCANAACVPLVCAMSLRAGTENIRRTFVISAIITREKRRVGTSNVRLSERATRRGDPVKSYALKVENSDDRAERRCRTSGKLHSPFLSYAMRFSLLFDLLRRSGRSTR